MLIEKLIVGLVAAPFLFRPKLMVASNDQVEPVLPGLDPPPMATVAALPATDLATDLATDDIPWPELPHMRTPKAAVREFLDEMIEFCGGDTIRFSRLAWSYEDMRKGRAKSDDCDGYAPRPWPQIKDRTLSMLLCEMGCIRVKPVTRDAEGRRPTSITIPAPAVDDDLIDEVSEPLRLVA